MHAILCYEKFIRKKILQEEEVGDVSQRNTPRETLGHELLEAVVLDFLEGRTREVQCERTLIPLSSLEADWREPLGSSFRTRKTYALHGEYTRALPVDR